MKTEIPILFQCESEELVGIIHTPPKNQLIPFGVLIIVGGPQYRAGSHRQFVLLARDLAKSGIPVMRFDYRGMGDSGGRHITFEESLPDIASAINAFVTNYPNIHGVILCGLCDAASASLIYSITDTRIQGLVLMNPWVRTDAGNAKAHLKYYYKTRVIQKEFWGKLFRFQLNYKESFHSLLIIIKNVISSPPKKESVSKNRTFQEEMKVALSKFKGKILIIISGNDLTANEFVDWMDALKIKNRRLKAPRVKCHKIKDADHTFSRKLWKKKVSNYTFQWLKLFSEKGLD